MTGQVADYFVGGVSVVIGAVMLFFAAFNWDRLSALRKPRWLEDRLGHSGARLFFGALGAALVALGIAIAAGFAPNARGQRRAGLHRQHAAREKTDDLGSLSRYNRDGQRNIHVCEEYANAQIIHTDSHAG